MKYNLEQQAYEKFFFPIMQNNLQALVRAAHEILACPVAVNDAIFRIIAILPDHPVDNPYFDYTLENNQGRESAFSRLYNIYIKHYEQHHFPVLLKENTADTSIIYFTILKKKKKILGYAVFLLSNNPASGDPAFIDSSRQVILLFTEAAATILANCENSSNYDRIGTEKQLIELLEAKNPDFIKKQPYWRNLQVKFAPDYVFILCKWPNILLDEVSIEKICFDLQKITNHLFAFYYQDQILILCSHLKDRETSEARRLLQELVTVLNTYHLSVGISSVFQKLEFMSEFYYQAELALETGTKIYPKQLIHTADACQQYMLFTAFLKQHSILPFIHPLIFKIYQYDKKNRSEYLTTLSAYLTYMADYKMVSGYLKIHHNTLLYRLKRMEDLFEIDFSNFTLLHILSANFDILKAYGSEYPTLFDQWLD